MYYKEIESLHFIIFATIGKEFKQFIDVLRIDADYSLILLRFIKCQKSKSFNKVDSDIYSFYKGLSANCITDELRQKELLQIIVENRQYTVADVSHLAALAETKNISIIRFIMKIEPAALGELNLIFQLAISKSAELRNEAVLLLVEMLRYFLKCNQLSDFLDIVFLYQSDTNIGILLDSVFMNNWRTLISQLISNQAIQAIKHILANLTSLSNPMIPARLLSEMIVVAFFINSQASVIDAIIESCFTVFIQPALLNFNSATHLEVALHLHCDFIQHSYKYWQLTSTIDSLNILVQSMPRHHVLLAELICLNMDKLVNHSSEPDKGQLQNCIDLLDYLIAKDEQVVSCILKHLNSYCIAASDERITKVLDYFIANLKEVEPLFLEISGIRRNFGKCLSKRLSTLTGTKIFDNCTLMICEPLTLPNPAIVNLTIWMKQLPASYYKPEDRQLLQFHIYHLACMTNVPEVIKNCLQIQWRLMKQSNDFLITLSCPSVLNWYLHQNIPENIEFLQNILALTTKKMVQKYGTKISKASEATGKDNLLQAMIVLKAQVASGKFDLISSFLAAISDQYRLIKMEGSGAASAMTEIPVLLSKLIKKTKKWIDSADGRMSACYITVLTAVFRFEDVVHDAENVAFLISSVPRTFETARFLFEWDKTMKFTEMLRLYSLVSRNGSQQFYNRKRILCDIGSTFEDSRFEFF